VRIVVFGAAGRTGRPVVRALCAAGHNVIAAGRDMRRLATIDARAEPKVADFEQPASVAAALASAECVVNLAHARFTGTILAQLPATCRRLVVLGSTRKFTRFPDWRADAVREAEVLLAAATVPSVLLHPTMIYGAPEERNVGRVLRLFARWPRWLPLVAPLPGGGRTLVQPVYQDDVAAAVVAAIERDDAVGPPIIVAGPEPMSYAALVRACAKAVGRRAFVLPVPTGWLVAIARIARALRLPFPLKPDEVRRATEDKAFDVTAMRQRLGVTPRPFERGLAERVEAMSVAEARG
jgi:nucleoside-diphosphate-sugar epimerase